jgi:hypothetical protein
MIRNYKNTLDLKWTPDPLERRLNISKEIVRHADYLPKTLTYEDIDKSFKKWVDEKIDIVQDGIKLPTMVLYSNQRFSEYMQTWKFTDENNNVRVNFKTVTRENNPSHGTIVGDSYNIPGDRFYTLKSFQAIDNSGKRYRIDYKMKQPTSVDLIYKVSIMTNRYISINNFNETIHTIFNSKQTYISPNGHYMSMTLENISDESEYNIQDRQFFSQSFNVKVRGYIIRESDFKIEENPIASIISFDGDGKRRKPSIELSEYDPCYVEEEGYYNKPIEIDVDLSLVSSCKNKTIFTIDEDFTLSEFVLKESSNLIPKGIKLYVNENFISDDLLSDACEEYRKCNQIPDDANHENTKNYDEIPSKKVKYYKYIIVNGEYYFWHQINFKDGDEILIETKKINVHKPAIGYTLIGYNRFVAYPIEKA